MKSYAETIQRLASQSFSRHMQGSWDTTPDGTSLVAWLFGKDSTEVLRDVEIRTQVLIDAQVKRYKE